MMVKLLPQANMASARSFLEELIEKVPYPIHTAFANNGI